MTTRTRTTAKSPADRVYNSLAPVRQVKFRQRKQNVTHRPSFNAGRPSRQETLTQMDFVNLQQLADIDEESSVEEVEEEEHTRKRKRRRVESDALASAKFHTQTLTQLDFVSSPALRLENLSDEVNDECHPAYQKEPASRYPTNRSMGPPKTPNRLRIFEIPSSQSPASPSPIRRQARSPLKAIESNFQKQNPLPSLEPSVQKSPKVEPIDVIDFGDNSQHSRIQQTPETTQPKEEHITPSASHKPIKDEILDSDEDDDYNDYDDLGPYYDDPNLGADHMAELEPRTELEADATIKQSPMGDTQEAEEQLHSDILFYTQLNPPLSQNPLPRLSQATTVDLSQHPDFNYPYPQHNNSPVPEQQTLIPDSPTVQISSGQSLVRPNSLPLAQADESQDCSSVLYGAYGMRVPLFLPSSQILTPSQMLPESLMEDSIPPPPLFIEDSDWEE